MTLAWDRTLNVTVGALTFKDNRMLADTRRTMDEQVPTLVFDIWNLSDDTVAQLVVEDQQVVVTAGYGGDLSEVFDGFKEGRGVKQVRRRVDTITRIEAVGQVSMQVGEGMGVTTRTFEGEVSVRSIASDLVTLDLGMRAENLEVIPANLIQTNFAYNGATTMALDDLLRDTGVRWYEDGGAIRFALDTELRQGVFSTVLSPDRGLIGSPIATEEGAQAKSVFVPGAELDGVVTLDSTAVKGDWKVFGIRHLLGNGPRHEFSTTFELRNTEMAA